MATANALAAIENGARRVEGTINGIGERAGNTALEEVAVALHIRKDFYQAETNIVLNQFKNSSDLISRLSGMPVPRNKAVIGGNAYAHESGIHQDGVLKILIRMKSSPLLLSAWIKTLFHLANFLANMPSIRAWKKWATH